MGCLVALLLPGPASPASAAQASETPASASTPAPAEPAVDLSPANWPEGDLARYRALDLGFDSGPKLARGGRGVIATTSQGGSSVRAGLEALRQGGSAVDAALTVALTQIALVMGSWTSYAGALSMVVYDAESGQVFSLDAPFATVLGEGDPLGIPPPGAEEGTGRSVLVPGFMAGVQAAHDRFGRLPWAELFTPALYFAEEGFELTPGHLGLMEQRREVLERRPQTRRIFRHSDGRPYRAGDRFRQPALARTLRGVADQGADFMYRGEWARELVRVTRAAGGRLTLADLQAYRPLWSEPLHAPYRGFDLVTMGLPNHLGVQLAQTFHLLEAARLDRSRPYWENAEALYRLIQIVRLGPMLTVPSGRASLPPADLFGELDLSPYARTRPETARRLWQRIRQPGWPRQVEEALRRATAAGRENAGTDGAASPPHSDAVVVADEAGDMVALTHSIITSLWGEGGLFVGGVSISDAGYPQRVWVAEAGPGRVLPRAMNPAIVLREGKPVAASAAIGRGLHELTVQNLLAMLDFGLDPRQALEAPKFLSPYSGPSVKLDRASPAQRVPEEAFDPQVLAGVEARGQALHRQPPQDRSGGGFWVGLRIDPESGLLEAAAPAMDAYAEGF